MTGPSDRARELVALRRFADLLLRAHRVRRDPDGARVWRCACGSAASLCPVQRARVASGLLAPASTPWRPLVEDVEAGRLARAEAARTRMIGAWGDEPVSVESEPGR